MAYLTKALLPGEAVEQQPKFSNMAQFGAPTVEFVLIVVVWWVLRQAALQLSAPHLPENPTLETVLRWAYWIGLGVFTLRFAWRMGYRALRQKFRELAVTNRRYMEKDGVFNVRFWSTDLEKIVRLSIDQPILGRVFNYGSVTIVTVGEVEHTTAGIAAPISLQNALHARMEAHRATIGTHAVDAPPTPDPLSNPVRRPADV